MGFVEKEIKVRATFIEEVLGMASNNPDIHSDYIISKAPKPKLIEEEENDLLNFDSDADNEKQTTVFLKTADGEPYIYDYHIKGYFKDCCGMLNRKANSESKKLKAYKKVIDGLVFVKERKILFKNYGDKNLKHCERPLRASTAQGERIALARSEVIPPESYIEFTVQLLDGKLENVVREWLDYGALRGFAQWRNSGKGRFTWEEIG